MKLLRLCLLLLLAVLLPLRGALAAAAPCAGDGLPVHLGQAHAQGHAMHHHTHHMHHMASADGHGGPHAHDHGHDDAAKCNLCASCCSAPPLPPTFSPAVVPLEGVPARFAVLQAPVPAFLAGGQERPPRSA